MRTRKLIAGTLASILAIAACGGDDDSSSSGASSDSPAGTSAGAEGSAAPNQADCGTDEIRYTDWQFDGAGRGQALLRAAEAFADQPGAVPTNAEHIAFPQYQDTILTQIGGGNGPDVMNLIPTDFYNLQDEGVLMSLDGKLERPDSDFIAPDEGAFVDGERFGVVHSVQSYALFINQDLFDEAGMDPPTTYEEFRNAARELTHGDQFGFAVRHSTSDEAGWWYDLSNWVYGFGGRWSDDSGNPTVDSPEVIEAVTEFADLVNEGVHAYGSDGASNRRAFWENRVAMMIDNAAVPANLLAENPDLNLRVVPVPFEHNATVNIPIFTAVNADAGNPNGAVCFVNYWLDEATQSGLAEATRGNILATEQKPSQQLLKEAPWLPVFAESAANSFSEVPTGYETEAAAFRTEVLREVDQVIVGGKDPADAMADAQAAVKGLG